MKPSALTAAFLLSLAALSTSHAAVTLGFSTGANAAEGWTNSSGSDSATMVWGIIVDTQGDGFDGFVNATTIASDGGLLLTGGASYNSGFAVSGTTTLAAGQLLLANNVVTDDRLYLSNNLMALVNGDVRISSLTNMAYDGNMAAGDKYAIVWFDRTTLGGTMAFGGKYGAWYKDGVVPTTATVLPADPGSYTTAGNGPAGMFGGDETASAKQANLILDMPEPSSALLGLLGAISFLRRRR